MRPGDDITELARQILARRQGSYERQFILFLGQECADAAGVPAFEQIARQVLADPGLQQRYLPDGSLDSRSDILAAFEELLEDLSVGQRYRMLQSFYTGVPVPSFYQDLALLVKSGYFDHILTTNIDNLLEQALIATGLIQDRDFEVFVLGQTEKLPGRIKSVDAERARVSVIKLHGDLARQRAAITRDEISDALEPQRAFIKGEISGDMIVVGYQLESKPLNQWLSWVPGSVWWVGPAPDDESTFSAIRSRREVRPVYKESSGPQVFFSQLAWLLLRTPAQALQEAAQLRSGEDMPGGEEITIDSLPGVEYTDAVFIETQLQRSRSILQALEQSQAPGEKNPQLENQLDYQRREVAALEARLRDLEPNRKQLLELMDALRLSVERAARKDLVDKNAASYLRKQVSAVEGEYRRENPNQSIIAAAIGATVMLVGQFDEQVVDPQLIHRLVVFSPAAGLR